MRVSSLACRWVSPKPLRMTAHLHRDDFFRVEFDQAWTCDVCDEGQAWETDAQQTFTDQGWSLYACPQCFARISAG